MTDIKKVSFLRLLAIMVYDSLGLIAVLMAATAIVVTANGSQIEPNNPFFSLFLLLICFLFLGWFWTHGGQTLGMLAWRVKLTQNDGKTITWKVAGIRFITALLSWPPAGLGFLWVILDENNKSWHDHLSKTHLQLLPKKGK